jgi:hypothetical protein
MRVVLPDLLWYAKRYVQETEMLMESNSLPKDRKIHDTFLNTIYGGYLNKKRFGLEHCYMYDVPTIVNLLEQVGFNQITLCEYRKGKDEELASKDNRPEESFHVECRKYSGKN